MSDYHVTPLVSKLPATVPFVGPETQERNQGYVFKARIGANENVFGPSPMAVQAMAKAALESWMYGDPEFHDLRQDLAAHLKVAPENIMVGEGIDGMLGYVSRMFLEAGDLVVTSAGAYPTFNYHVNGYGGKLEFVPYRDDQEDLEALLESAKVQKAKLLYVSNPDNPMGSWWDEQSVRSLMEKVPQGTLLILDEAYGEFAPPGTLPPLDVTNARVLRLRTFSKAYGLAGMRVGYAIGNAKLIREFNKVRNHFGVGRVAQAAARAALKDTKYLQKVINQVGESLEKIRGIALENGLKPLPTASNFVAIDCGKDGTFAAALMNVLIQRGIFVRMPGVAPLNRCIRINAGLQKDLDALSEALPGALEEVLSSFLKFKECF